MYESKYFGEIMVSRLNLCIRTNGISVIIIKFNKLLDTSLLLENIRVCYVC